jgi:hypothetical protein
LFAAISRVTFHEAVLNLFNQQICSVRKKQQLEKKRLRLQLLFVQLQLQKLVSAAVSIKQKELSGLLTNLELKHTASFNC